MWQQITELLTYDPSSPLLFNSGLFLVLFLLFVPVFYLLRRHHLPRTIWVVLFSLYFYYLSSGVYFVLLILLATTDFIIGRQIAQSESRSGKKSWLILSLLLDLGLLCYFKYTNFLYDSFAPLFGASPEGRHFDIFLPVGISFFTFQSLSYVIDIYRGKIEPLKRWIDYLFYISFFPQLVAGPIVRAVDFIPQIHRIPRVSREDFGRGLFLIICGLLKKGVISDYISLNFVDRVFDQPLLYSGFENLMGVYGYALQIYCDFSGYSDIAIGLALWMGYHFNTNFDFPYKSATNRCRDEPGLAGRLRDHHLSLRLLHLDLLPHGVDRWCMGYADDDHGGVPPRGDPTVLRRLPDGDSTHHHRLHTSLLSRQVAAGTPE